MSIDVEEAHNEKVSRVCFKGKHAEEVKRDVSEV
jgi:hypothetical protein